MNKIDYEKARENQIKDQKKGKKLLLHSCCAPCSSGVLDRLIDFFEITIYFYNPNMDSLEEFNKRANEQIRYIKEGYGDKIKVVVADYNKNEYLRVKKQIDSLKIRTVSQMAHDYKRLYEKLL